MLPEVPDFRLYKNDEQKDFSVIIEPKEDMLHLPDGRTFRRVRAPHPMGGLVFAFEDVSDRLATRRAYNSLLSVQQEILDNLFDPVLIFGLFGLPKMGISGAAAATVIGQMIAGILAVVLNHTKNKEVQIDLHHFRPDKNIIGQIYVIGVPSIVMQAIGSVMNYGMNRILIAFSSTATAVFGVYFKLQSFVFMPAFGLNNGVIPVMAYNYGARNKKRVLKSYFISLFYSFTTGLILGLLLFIFGHQFMSLFATDAAVIDAGMQRIKIMAFSYCVSAFMDCTIAASRGLGKTVIPTIIIILGSCVFRIVWIYTIFAWIHTIPALFLLYLFSWIITSIAEIIYFIIIYRKL